MILDNISTNCERTLKILLQEFCRGYIIIEKKLFFIKYYHLGLCRIMIFSDIIVHKQSSILQKLKMSSEIRFKVKICKKITSFSENQILKSILSGYQ